MSEEDRLLDKDVLDKDVLDRDVDIRAVGRARVNAVGRDVNARGDVNFGDQYKTPIPSPKAIGNIEVSPENRTLWIDRAGVQKELLARVKDEATVLVELVAAGGAGKTSLASWLHDEVEAAQKVIWVRLSEASPFYAVAQWALYELDVLAGDQVDELALIRRLVLELRRQRCLVVLDQIEKVAEAASWKWFETFFAEWCRKGRSSTVLVTTRRRLLSDGAFHLPLSGFEPLEGSAFLRKLGVIAESESDLQGLSVLCSGHPLLLNLSASWLEKTKDWRLDASDLESFEKLFQQDLGDPEAQVEEIFKRLLARLPERVRRALLDVSVYRVAFGLAQAQAMQAEIAQADLEGLAAQGFLLTQENRWRLHPLMNQLVADALRDEGGDEGAHRKAIAYFEGKLQAEKTDIQDYLEGFHHYCECLDFEAAYDIINRCFNWLDLQGQYRILVSAYGRLTVAWRDDRRQEKSTKEKFGEALTRLGIAYRALGKYGKAIDYQQQSLTIRREIGDRKGEAASLGNLGNAYQSLGEYGKAIDYQQQSLTIQREIGDRKGEANSLVNLGIAYRALGEYGKAIDYQQQSLTIQREIGDRNGEAKALGNLGAAYYSLGEYGKAIDYQQQSLTITREIGDRNGEAKSIGNLGTAYDSLGEYGKAIGYQQQSLTIKREIGDRNGEAKSLGNLGPAYDSLGEYGKAIDYQQQSLTIKREIGDRNGEAASLGNLGFAYAKIDEHWKSRDHFEQAKALFTELKLAHMVEKCEKAIQERNQIIAAIPKKAPPLPTKAAEPDWWANSLPEEARSQNAPPKKQPLPRWLAYVVIFAIIALVVITLQ
ncbi:MAG: tetratricopeptide repeat protein [Phormidesmis sp.]